MDDLISRQALCEYALNQKDKSVSPNDIMRFPTAQPEPHEGHWIRTDCGLDVECKCSACGYKDFVSPHDTYWFKRNYCPNCGAKMKGERQK